MDTDSVIRSPVSSLDYTWWSLS